MGKLLAAHWALLRLRGLPCFDWLVAALWASRCCVSVGRFASVSVVALWALRGGGGCDWLIGVVGGRLGLWGAMN